MTSSSLLLALFSRARVMSLLTRSQNQTASCEQSFLLLHSRRMLIFGVAQLKLGNMFRDIIKVEQGAVRGLIPKWEFNRNLKQFC